MVPAYNIFYCLFHQEHTQFTHYSCLRSYLLPFCCCSYFWQVFVSLGRSLGEGIMGLGVLLTTFPRGGCVADGEPSLTGMVGEESGLETKEEQAERWSERWQCQGWEQGGILREKGWSIDYMLQKHIFSRTRISWTLVGLLTEVSMSRCCRRPNFIPLGCIILAHPSGALWQHPRPFHPKHRVDRKCQG